MATEKGDDGFRKVNRGRRHNNERTFDLPQAKRKPSTPLNERCLGYQHAKGFIIKKKRKACMISKSTETKLRWYLSHKFKLTTSMKPYITNIYVISTICKVMNIEVVRLVLLLGTIPILYLVSVPFQF